MGGSRLARSENPRRVTGSATIFDDEGVVSNPGHRNETCSRNKNRFYFFLFLKTATTHGDNAIYLSRIPYLGSPLRRGNDDVEGYFRFRAVGSLVSTEIPVDTPPVTT